MKNENLPQVGRDVIFETVQNDVFAGVFNGSDYVAPFSSGETTVFEGREVVAWIYAEDAFAAWKREQVRRLAIDVKTALAYADALLAELEKPQK